MTKDEMLSSKPVGYGVAALPFLLSSPLLLSLLVSPAFAVWSPAPISVFPNATALGYEDRGGSIRGKRGAFQKVASFYDLNLQGHNKLGCDENSRRLLDDDEFFAPSRCTACDKGSSTWTDYGFDGLLHKETVVIPCGVCITMDVPDDTLILPHGLDVQGALYFPGGYKLVLHTPFLRVQGLLRMRAKKRISGTPNIRVILTGEDESLTQFVPAEEHNKWVCTQNKNGNPVPCKVGIKPIVVAGGRLDLQGLPDDCRTWVNLNDVVENPLPQPPPGIYSSPPQVNGDGACKQFLDAPFVKEDFSTQQNQYGWTGGPGGSYSVTPQGTFYVHGRQSDTQDGPLLDLLNVRDCFVPGQTYLFSALVKLVHPNPSQEGRLTSCAKAKESCLTLRSRVQWPGDTIGRRKGWELDLEDYRYGAWEHFYSAFTFNEDEMANGATSHTLQLQGPKSEIDIELDDVTFTLLPANLVPDPDDVCGGNLIMNGGAEASSIQPHPMTTFNGGRVRVETDGRGNRFFRTRERGFGRDSIAYNLDAPGCLAAGARYRASAKIRIQSMNPVQITMVYRAFFNDRSVMNIVATCQVSPRTWEDCSDEFIVPVDFPSIIDRVRLSFDTGDSKDNFDVDDWALEFIEGPLKTLVVDEAGVSNCWDKHAEILVTSATTQFEHAQVRRLVSRPSSDGNGNMLLQLDGAISPTATRKHDERFAVEVALLSRGIVFEGADERKLVGAHLIVLHTPGVKQKIDGVEFVNFGQQGFLGRYPIHFHLCKDVNGAVVSRNSIRNSNQRCIVVHGSHNLTVSGNVAFETHGHCYMLEDGGEFDNKFIENLGASTRAATFLVKEDQTDRSGPSTYWCSNPVNTWDSNVAAGSAGNAYWFELFDHVRGPTAKLATSAGVNPARLPLQLFRGNVAHSNRDCGLRNYPEKGWQPPDALVPAVFEDLRSYKNRKHGACFEQSRNMVLKGGVLADNAVSQVDLHRTGDTVIEGTAIMGVTPRFREMIVQLREAQQAHLLPGEEEEEEEVLAFFAPPAAVVGVEVHSFTRSNARGGAAIRSATFSSFPDGGILVKVDGTDKRRGYFDHWTTVQGVQVADDVSATDSAFFGMKEAVSNGISNAYIVDADSSMNPTGGGNGKTSSTIVSNSPEMTAFLDLEKCDLYSEQSFLYCTDTCLRTVTFATSPAETEDFVLRVSDDTGKKQYDFAGHYYYANLPDDENRPDEAANTVLGKYRYFVASLPPGNYRAQFFAKSGDDLNEPSWPTFVLRRVEPSLCEGSLDGDDDVELFVPPPLDQECGELIRNGDAEASEVDYPHWLHLNAALKVAPGAGIGKSNAIVAWDPSSTKAASIGQYVDVRCLQENDDEGVVGQFDIQAWVYLELDGKPYFCELEDDCPIMRIRVKQRASDDGDEVSANEIITPVATSFVRPYDETGYNLLQATLSVGPRIARGTSVALVVERGNKNRNARMFLDNVSMTRVEPGDCHRVDFVFNGDFATGTSVYWDLDTGPGAELEMVHREQDGDEDDDGMALQLVGRKRASDTIAQRVRTGCLAGDKMYLATARVRLLDPDDGSAFHCRDIAGKWCPRMRLRSVVNAGLPSQDATFQPVADTDYGGGERILEDGWYTLTGIFYPAGLDVQAEERILSFDQVPAKKDFAIDDVSIRELEEDCSELIIKVQPPDDDENDPARFWRPFISGSTANMKVVGIPGSAFEFYDRAVNYDGPSRSVDPRCLAEGSHWKLTAHIQLISRSTGLPVACKPKERNPLNEACPAARVAGYDRDGKKGDDVKFFMDNCSSPWNANSFNRYEVTFNISSSNAAANRVVIAIRNYDIDWNMRVANVSVTPV